MPSPNDDTVQEVSQPSVLSDIGKIRKPPLEDKKDDSMSGFFVFFSPALALRFPPS